MKELNMNGDLGPGESSTQHLTNGNMVITRKSPFDEEQEDGETISSESSEPAVYLNHQNVSRGQSPSIPAQQQDGSAQLGATILPAMSNGPSSKPSSTSSGQTEDQMTSPVPFASQPSESAVPATGGMENTNMSYAAVQMQMQGMTISSEGMTQQQQQQMQQQVQQQQQQVISSQQQHQQQTYIMQQQQAMQQAGIQMGSSPYFMTNAQAGQDPYNGQGISIVNANGNTYIQQQMPQSAGQVRTPTTSTASGQPVPQPQQQQISGVPAGYQVIQTPLNIPAGSTFYDQHGNPVIINGRIAAPMAGAQI